MAATRKTSIESLSYGLDPETGVVLGLHVTDILELTEGYEGVDNILMSRHSVSAEDIAGLPVGLRDALDALTVEVMKWLNVGKVVKAVRQ